MKQVNNFYKISNSIITFLNIDNVYGVRVHTIDENVDTPLQKDMITI